MTEVISVKFKNRGKTYFFAPNGKEIKSGQQVVVETGKGLELADCVCGNHAVEDTAVVQPLRPVVRAATRDDLRVAEVNKRREKEAFDICREKIAEHGLDMKLVDVECSFEGNKTTFFFTSDGRVDFRELVKDLAGIFRNRIELRQIGVRDEAKMLGGIGICGRPFCCSRFIDEFKPVSTKMAKIQSMSLNPGKISGSCGRLMCCLRYEQEAYEALVKTVPKQGSFVQTPDGYGNVTQVNLLRQMVKVKLDGEGEDTIKTYRAVETAVVPGGRPKDGEKPPQVLNYIPPEPEEEEEPDEWAIPNLLIESAPLEPEKIEPAKKQRRGGNRRRRGGGKSAGQSDAGAPEEKKSVKPKQKNRGGGKNRNAETDRKGPDSEKKKPQRRYYHRGKPKNRGGRAQNQQTEG